MQDNIHDKTLSKINVCDLSIKHTTKYFSDSTLPINENNPKNKYNVVNQHILDHRLCLGIKWKSNIGKAEYSLFGFTVLGIILIVY